MRERGRRGVRDGGLQPRAGDGPGRRRRLRRRGVHQPRPRPPRLPRRRRGLLRGQGRALHARAGPARPGQRRRRVRPPAGSTRPTIPIAHVLGRRAPTPTGGRRRRARPRRGSTFTVLGPDGRQVAAGVPLAGDFNVANALAAIAALAEAGFDAAAVAAGIAARPAGARPAGAGRRRAGLPRGRRLRAQARRRRGRAEHAAPAHRGPADHRDRRRRRPGPGQAPADGRDRGPARRRARRHRRQPAHRGPGRDPRRVLAGAATAAAPRCVEIGDRRDGDPRRRCAAPAPATSCWSPARATRQDRRSGAWCTRSTTARSSARSSRRVADDPDDPGRDRRRRRRTSSHGDPATVVDRCRPSSTPARSSRAGSSSPRRRARRRPRLRRRRSRRARPPCSAAGRPACPPSWSTTRSPRSGTLARDVRRPAARPDGRRRSPARQGKTSTKDLLAQVLGRGGPTVATAGTFNNEIGVPLTVLRATRDTRYLVVEMGARGVGHIAYLCGDRPPDGRRRAQRRHRPHRRVRQPEDIARQGRARRGAARRRRRRAQRRRPCVAAMARAHGRPGVITFGEPAADVRVARRRRSTTSGGRRFALASRPAHRHRVSARASRGAPGRERGRGRRVALAVGLAARRVADALSAAEPGRRWRMEVHERADGRARSINDAYNANPDIMRAALEDAGRRSGGARPGRTVAVLGEMRELGDARHRPSTHAIGRLAAAARRRRSSSWSASGAPDRRRRRREVVDWGGDGRARRRARRGSRVVAREVAAGDVVLVKASRAAAWSRSRPLLDEATADEDGRGREPMRAILLGGRPRAARHPARHPRARSRSCAKQGYGQPIRDDGPTTHHTKRGTPTMGGLVIILAVVLGYFAAKLHHPGPAVGLGPAAAVPVRRARPGRLPGRLHQDRQAAQPRPAEQGQDDRPDRGRARRSGSRAVAVRSRTTAASTPASQQSPSSATSRLELPASSWSLLIWVIVAGTSNAVNLTDGLDGLATGASMMVFGAYTLVDIWQNNQSCAISPTAALLRGARPARPGGRRGRDHRRLLRLPVVERLAGRRSSWATPARCRSAARSPGFAIMTRTELLLVVLGGLFVDHHAVGDPPGRLLQGHQGQTHLPDGAAPPPLRDARLGGGHHRDPVLDHHRPLRRRRPRDLLRRVGRRRLDEHPSRTLAAGRRLAGTASARSSPASACPASPPPTPCTHLGASRHRARRADAERQGREGRSCSRSSAPTSASGEGATATLPDDVDLLVTSPGLAARPPAAARRPPARGVPVWGEVELAWRLRDPSHAAPWLGVTGTNGKTTTVQMLDAILRAAGLRSVAAGNVGLPLVEAVMDPEPYDVLAVELSSFQLHYTDSMSARVRRGAQRRPGPPRLARRPRMADYAADKGRIYERRPARLRLQRRRPGDRARWSARPTSSRAPGRSASPWACPRSGWSAWSTTSSPTAPSSRSGDTSAAELCTLADLASPAPHNRRQRARRGRAGPRPRRPAGGGPRRAARLPARRPPDRGRSPRSTGSPRSTTPRPPTRTPRSPRCTATTPSSGSPAGWPRAPGSTSWCRPSRGRLRGVVLLGADRRVIAEALSRHAPDVPVIEVAGGETEAEHDPWSASWRRRPTLARPGDTVLLAPGCASMDMFADYAARGDAFAEAVRRLDGTRLTTEGRATHRDDRPWRPRPADRAGAPAAPRRSLGWFAALRGPSTGR